MTVTANTTRNDYVGNGQSVYSYTFQLNDASDVTVYLDGVVQTLNTHYTVENVGVGSGGTITFTLVDENNNPIHPSASNTISIVMEMDLDRDTNYQQSGLFAASDVNNDFDRLWLATNQQQTRLGRSIHIANNDLDRDMFLPLYNQRANKVIAFDSNGNVTTSTADYADWDTSYNNMITSASFSGGNYTMTQQDGGTISTSLDGRYLPLSGGTLTGDVEFGANKAKFVGLEIYNTIGNTSVIEETGAGNLNIKGQDVRIQTPTNEDIIKGEADGAVTLYYDNNAKLATTNTGISVTGTLSATGYNDSNWNDAYNNKITAVDYTGSTLTLTQQDGGTLTTTINGALGTSLVYNGATKAEAVATGLDVTGTATMDGLVVDGGLDVNMGTGVADFSFNDGGYLKIHNASRTSDYRISTIGSSAQELRFRNGASQDLLRLNKNGDISFYEDTGTTPKFFWDASAERLGIGTTSPSELLHVTGASTAKVQISSTSTTGISGVHFGDPDDVNSGRVQYEHNTDHMGLYTNNTEKVRIDSSGNVGIGTSSPDSLLEVVGADPILTVRDTETGLASTNATLRLAESGGGDALNNYWDINYTANNALRVLSNTSERMRIDDTGNVGIGTTSPTFDNGYSGLHISQTAPSIHLTPTSSGTTASDGYAINVNSSGIVRHINKENQPIEFHTNNTERMRIDSSGNVGIGTASPNYELTVAGGGNNSIQIVSSTTGTGATNGLRFWNTGSSTAMWNYDNTPTLFGTNNNERMRIDSSGNVGIGTTSPDARLHVVGVSSTSHVATFQSGTFQTAVYLKDTGTTANQNLGFRSFGDDLSIITNGSPNFTFTEAGRLGIGTIFPADDLDIENSDGAVIRLGRGTTSNIANDRLGAINFYNEDSSDEGPNNAVVIEGRTEDTFGSSGVLILKTNASATEGAEAGETMRLNSAGNVGIGTTSPATKLDVNGSLRASGLTYPTSDGTANQVMVTDGSGNLSFASRSLWASGGLSYIGSSTVLVSQSTPSVSTTTAKLNVFKYNSGTTPDSNSTVFFDSSGNNVLQLGSGSYNISAINFGNSFSNSKGRIEVNQGGGYMAFWNNYSERMRINSSGNLGIATSSPSCELTVHGGGSYVPAPSDTVMQLRDTSNPCYANIVSHNMGNAGIYFGDINDNDRAGVIYSNYSDRLDFNANASTRMSINSSGYVGINTTTPAVPLDINGNKLRIRDSFTPSSASSSGNKGDICYDSNYMYVCVATNTWKRAALASW